MTNQEYFRLRRKAFAVLEETTKGHFSHGSAVRSQPNWIHPWSVHIRLIAHGVINKEVLLAAILHDIVEDSDTTLDYLEREFSPRVARLVGLVSKSKQYLSEAEEVEFYHTLLQSNDIDAITLKVFDRIDNILSDWTFKTDAQGVGGYIENTKKYYAALGERVGLTAQLNTAVDYMKNYHKTLK